LSRDLVVYESVKELFFMNGLTVFCQVLFMLWVDFWPKFACAIETIGWKTERWHL